MKIGLEAPEHHPGWAADRRRPRIAEIRWGVRYTGLEIETVRALLLDRRFVFRSFFALGAVGPGLQFARHDGPWVPYRADAYDANIQASIRARAWPWRHGDAVWFGGTVAGLPCAIQCLDEGLCDLYPANPNLYDLAWLRGATMEWALETSPHVANLSPLHVWTAMREPEGAVKEL